MCSREDRRRKLNCEREVDVGDEGLVSSCQRYNIGWSFRSLRHPGHDNNLGVRRGRFRPLLLWQTHDLLTHQSWTSFTRGFLLLVLMTCTLTCLKCT
jgi:hypothetical protein